MSADSRLPSREVLLTLFDYDPDTGALTWKERPVTLFVGKFRDRTCAAWNARWVGKPALASPHSGGYFDGMIFGVRYLAHRVIWAMVYGDVPDEIDHEDGDRANNRLANLADGSNGANARNSGKRSDNTSGRVGVYWSKAKRRWKAQINYQKREYSLGYFDQKADAISARVAAERKFGFHQNHGKARLAMGRA